MKISTLTTMLLITGVLLVVTTLMITESETNYDINVNKTGWDNGQYDFADDINNSIAPIQKTINDISNEDNGWIIIGSGFTGLIKAITLLPKLFLNLIIYGNNLIVGFGTVFSIPPTITQIFLVMLYVWGIYSLIEILQRWNI